MKLTDFDYELPSELIAHAPLNNRDESKLMVINKIDQTINHHRFRDIIDILPANALLVLNDTKVRKARLKGHRKTGAKVEVFLLENTHANQWKALIKPSKRVNENEELIISDELSIKIHKKDPIHGEHTVELLTELDQEEAIEHAGETPLPPYIDASDMSDEQINERYQTVVAKKAGAVAAPTAGLHFTPELLKKCREKGISTTCITLDVGYGTFKPVTATAVTNHKMHTEHGTISEESAALLNDALKEGRPIIAVGTTVTRSLESCISNEVIQSGPFSTDIFIYPGKQVSVISGLITNFHLPKSSLIMLVSALIGLDLTKKAYLKAIEQKYRFYSFGDAMLII
jgi:S-adenosylmethionine:tRNA ribosyltransferase-isomerase